MAKNKNIEVELARIIIDETRPEQVVVLREKKGKRMLPIVIGAPEAAAIKMEIAGVHPLRPMTHDLLKDALSGLGARLDKVVIDSLKNDTFYAKLYLVNNSDDPIVIDARPSDSIALALRIKAPIFVAIEVMDIAGRENGSAEKE